MVATLIAAPYAFDYDLVLLAIPIGVAAKATLETPGPPGVRSALVLLGFTPVLVATAGRWLHLPIGPAALWLVFFALRALLDPVRMREPADRTRRARPHVSPLHWVR